MNTARGSVDESVPNVTITILDATFSSLASHTFTSNLPGQTFPMGWIGCSVANNGAGSGAVSVDVFRGSVAIQPF